MTKNPHTILKKLPARSPCDRDLTHARAALHCAPAHPHPPASKLLVYFLFLSFLLTSSFPAQSPTLSLKGMPWPHHWPRQHLNSYDAWWGQHDDADAPPHHLMSCSCVPPRYVLAPAHTTSPHSSPTACATSPCHQALVTAHATLPCSSC